MTRRGRRPLSPLLIFFNQKHRAMENPNPTSLPPTVRVALAREAAADPHTDAAVLRLAAEWREAVDTIDKTWDESKLRSDKTAVDRMWAIKAQLSELPAHTIAGIITKLKHILLDDMSDRRKLLDRPMADLERVAERGAS
jgi:hypothetical protein